MLFFQFLLSFCRHLPLLSSYMQSLELLPVGQLRKYHGILLVILKMLLNLIPKLNGKASSIEPILKSMMTLFEVLLLKIKNFCCEISWHLSTISSIKLKSVPFYRVLFFYFQDHVQI